LVCPLYASLPAQQQLKVFQNTPPVRACFIRILIILQAFSKNSFDQDIYVLQLSEANAPDEDVCHCS
jgi:hypothetical protein